MQTVARMDRALTLQPGVALEEAVTLAAEGRYERARVMLTGLADRLAAAGDKIKAAEAAFWHAYTIEKLGWPAKAVPLYKKVTEDYPQTPAAKLAAQRLATLRRQAELSILRGMTGP